MKTLLRLFAASACLGLPASAAVLYTGSLGTRPDQQGWAYLPNPFPGSATRTIEDGGTTLNTTAVQGDQAGWFRFNEGALGPGGLDSTTGFTLRFDLQVIAETHASNDRAGFSVIVLDSQAKGVEIGFWTDEVWVQTDTPLFTHGDGAAFDTDAARVSYELTFQGSGFSLRADDTLLLDGALKDYSSFGNPYNLSNFLFLGDDTTSASASARLYEVELTAVPEPAEWLGIAAAASLGLALLRRR